MARKDIYNRITASIIESLDAGVIPWRKPWIGGYPANFTTDRAYRGVNTLMLECSQLSQGFESSQWLTFNQAKKIGAHIKAGSHGTPIIFWRFFEKEKVNQETGEKWIDRIPMAKGYTVFNSEQCAGLPEKEQQEHLDPIAAAEDIINGYKDAPQVEYTGGVAKYFPTKDLITLPERKHFASGEEFYSTLFHEAAHSTGHESRLDRNIKNGFGSQAYSNEELIAELGAAFLMGIAGGELVAKTIDNSAAYIAGWRKRISEDNSLIIKASSAAQKAADYITGEMN